MSKLLSVSMSPHDYSSTSVKKVMYGVIIAMLPALAVSIYYFGLGAMRVTLIAVASAMIFEWFFQKVFLKGKNTIFDGSAIITGMLIAFNVPSSLPCWIILIGTFVAIGVGKMSFGGLGNNPFNPALVGRVFMLISFPVDMTRWPEPFKANNLFSFSGMTQESIDAVTGPTPLAIIKGKLAQGESFTSIISNMDTSYMDWFIGGIGGSIGEISAAALILGGLYMLIKKIITWHIPVSMIGSIALFTGILYLINPNDFADPIFHILTGGVLLGAIFMATDMVTSPMTPKGMLIFGAGIGILTVVIRVWGAYPEGVSFAILIMNAVVPLINNSCKPKRFGEEKI